ncbi:hypothetical protein L7F22_068496 [Adiantum nelumboides]|nr:hypothetical protein [Adiantum nelumboides]
MAVRCRHKETDHEDQDPPPPPTSSAAQSNFWRQADVEHAPACLGLAIALCLVAIVLYLASERAPPPGIDVRPGYEDVDEVEDVAGLVARIAIVRFVLLTVEQARWDRNLPDRLAGLYAGRNEAKIALLCKEMESKIMNEEDDMDTVLAGVKDINEQLISAGEVISDKSLVQSVLHALPDSYQTFASTSRRMNQRNPEVAKFDEVCTLLLQEALSRKNRTRQRAVEHAFIAAQRKGCNMADLRDATRAFVSGNFTGNGLTDSVTGLSNIEIKSLVDWRSFYNKTYIYVGKLIGTYYDGNGKETKELRKVEAKAKLGERLLKQQEAEEKRYPACNSRWSQQQGGEVWCDSGYPRLTDKVGELPLTGQKNKRCACFTPEQLGRARLQVYEGCDPLQSTCKVS